MKRVVTYITTSILSLAVGCAIMYGLIYFFPNTIVKTVTKEQRVVNVVDNGISEGINNVYKSVIVVESYKNNSLVSSGSGFAFKSDKEYTYLITNHHVIGSGSKFVINLSDGSELEASLVASDVYSDIAVLKVLNTDKLLIATMGDTSKMLVGDTVFAVGAPMGKEYANTVTRGILSGKNRMVETAVAESYGYNWIMNVMQTDAAINPGNSGGPLCNVSGEIIGVTSMKIVESSVEGIGFAIPIEDTLNYANALMKDGKIKRGYIGVEMYNASEVFQLARNGIILDKDITEGAVIVKVNDDSPAKDANIKLGDVVLKINEHNISNISEFRYYLYKYSVGETITLSVYRDGKIQNIKVKIANSN